MPLIPGPARLIGDGAGRAFRGLRTGDQRSLLIGAAMVGFGLLRRSAPAKKELLVRQVVPEGATVVVRHRRGEAPRLEIREADEVT